MQDLGSSPTRIFPHNEGIYNSALTGENTGLRKFVFWNNRDGDNLFPIT